MGTPQCWRSAKNAQPHKAAAARLAAAAAAVAKQQEEGATPATTPRSLAGPVFDGLHDQDPVIGSDGFDGFHGEGESECFDSG
jgi:hypothetical protein